MYIHTCIHVYINIDVCTCVYIYIYIEREREAWSNQYLRGLIHSNGSINSDPTNVKAYIRASKCGSYRPPGGWIRFR